MELQTITTIELSSLCNLQCKYCINRLIEKNTMRERRIMPEAVFEASLRWLKILVKRGTQKEINLNGNGESLLDPDLIARTRRVKDVIGDSGVVMFCTNGVLLTRRTAIALKDAGLDRLDVSVHSAYHARRCAHLLTEINMTGVISDGAIKSSHNWAGQLEPEHSINMFFTLPCAPLMEGRGYINSDGHISPCCYDYRNLGFFGSVFDFDLLDKRITSFSLCASCHQAIVTRESLHEDITTDIGWK